MRVTTVSLALVSLLLVLGPSLAQPVQPTPIQAGRAGGRSGCRPWGPWWCAGRRRAAERPDPG